MPPPLPAWLWGLRKHLQGASRQAHQLLPTAAKAAQQKLEATQRAACRELLPDALAALCSQAMRSKLLFSSSFFPQSWPLWHDVKEVTLLQAPAFP